MFPPGRFGLSGNVALSHGMRELMYALPTIVIVAILFATMAAIVEIGYRCGRKYESAVSEATRGHVSSIQGAMLGILGLLLGFTFSLSLQRYDNRSVAVVKESNAIGTAYLRTELLPDDIRDSARANIQNYLDLRIEESTVDLSHGDVRKELTKDIADAFEATWKQATDAAKANPNPVLTGLYVQSLNDVADSFGERDAALGRHVPELVLILLYMTFLMTGLVVGFSAGLSGTRASIAIYVLTLLIVLLVFIVVDLDRPRRGIIEVDQQPMLDLQRWMHTNPLD
ncbi:hypothetical protein [Bremerella cremea]|uniref:bestrophin-like domain n=1 Tax=Bremerella cremea TaxID=1031537 RepID=UPI0031EC7BD6